MRTRIGIRGILFAVTLYALAGAGEGVALTDGSAIPIDADYAYEVRFLCGTADETRQEGVVRGRYDTEVVIANPGDSSVRFEKIVSRALPFQRSEAVTPPRRDVIEPGRALSVDCDEIRTHLPLPMTAQFRSGVLIIRAEERLEVSATTTSQPRDGEISSLDQARVAERPLVCEPGFGGPDCSIECRTTAQCDADIFYHANGTVNGVIARGTLLTTTIDAFDAGDVLADFKEWVRGHTGLLGLAPMPEAGVLDNLVESGRPPVVDGALVQHRFSQTYRGHPVVGPEATVSATAGDFRGVLSFVGTLLDERVDYLGLEAPLPEAAARASMLDWYRELTGSEADASSVSLEDVTFVAVPQRQTMGYAADVVEDGFMTAYIVVSAAVNDGGRAPLLAFTGMPEDLEDEQQIQLRAEDMVGTSAFATSNADPVQTFATDELVDVPPLSGAPLRGSVYEPSVCAGDPTAPGCGEIRLGNTSVVVLDAQGGPLTEPDADFVVPTDLAGTFLAQPGTVDFATQDQFYKLLNSLRLFDTPMLNQGRWETKTPQSSFPDGTYSPRLILVVEGPTESCNDQPACAGRFAPAPSNTLDIDPHEPPGGGAPEPYGYVVSKSNIRTVMFHEFGHTIDSFTARGILGDGVVGSGCTPDGTCVASCVIDTPDESRALGETAADLMQLYLIDRFYPQIPYERCGILGSPVSNSGGVTVHHPDCVDSASDIEHFDDTRPTAPGYEQVKDESGQTIGFKPTGWCDYTPGYRQDPVYQAWWKFTHNRECNATSPFACEPGVDDPTLDETDFADIGMQAFLYAMRQSNAQSYEMFFANMALFLDCRYGEEIGGFFRRVFAMHGLVEAGGPPLVCPAICGDGVAEDAEQCDAPDLAGASCTSIGQDFTGGTLGCTAQCTFETAACTTCGNGIIEAGEQCDGADLGGASCVSEGFDGGNLSCDPQTCMLDVSACTTTPQPSSCPEGGGPGDVGCACEPASSAEPPDGPGSFLTQVADTISINTGLSCPDELICGLTLEGGAPDQQATPVCLECPSPGSGGGDVPYGCPCVQDSDCQSSGVSGPVSGDFGGTSIALTCWGDGDGGWSGGGGTCLPRVNEVNPNSQPHPDAGAILVDELEEFERTKWLCKVPCSDLDVPGSGQHECAFQSGRISFDYATCLENSCGGEPGAICANDLGGHCGPNDTCQAECNPANNGTNASGGNPDCQAYGYPDVWQCTTWLATQRCGPPECAENPLTGGPGDQTLCDALIYGNLIPE